MSRSHYIVLTAIFEKEEDGRWTAHCEELGTATFAHTIDEVREFIIEAIELHLKTLEDVGEIKRFLEEHNIKLHKTVPPPSVKISIHFGTIVEPLILTIPISNKCKQTYIDEDILGRQPGHVTMIPQNSTCHEIKYSTPTDFINHGTFFLES